MDRIAMANMCYSRSCCHVQKHIFRSFRWELFFTTAVLSVAIDIETLSAFLQLHMLVIYHYRLQCNAVQLQP